MASKKVLVEIGDDSYQISISCDNETNSDLEAVQEAVAALVQVEPQELIVKIESEEWGGRWVNLSDLDIFPDKAVLKATIRPAKV